MNIPFTFEVVRVSTEHNVMDVQYVAAGYETMLVGMMIPTEGADLQEYIISHAPQHQWVESKKIIQNVQVGFSGIVTAETLQRPQLLAASASSIPSGIIGPSSVDDALLDAAIQRILQEQKTSTV